MKKLMIIFLFILLAGCTKLSEAEQFINDNPGVLDGDTVIHFSNADTTIKMYDLVDGTTNKVLYSVDTDELIVLYAYCDDGVFDATTEYEQRIFSADTFYGIFEKPECEVGEVLTVYYQEQKANGDWEYLGEIPRK